MRDLSVVVSAHGSCDRVAACLGALAAQTLPADRFEVVVVIHGPDSSARHAVADLERAVGDADVVVLLQRHRGYDVDALARVSRRFLDTRGVVTPGEHAERL